MNIIHKHYEPIKVDHVYDRDSIKIKTREFSDVCNQASTLGCQYLQLLGSASTFEYKGYLPDGTIKMSNFLKKGDQNDDLMTVNVPKGTIKSLSKLNNISAKNALLKSTFVPDTPVKIKSNIGSYGTYKIYLRNQTIH